MLQDKHAAGTPSDGWSEPRATALLVLQDGTVLEGFGIGADGRGDRRGLLQHRDDRLSGNPDRPLLCRPDHHLHLPAYRQCRHQRRRHRDRQRCRRPQACAASILGAAVTEPSNWRATRHLDAWLKARGIVGLTGIDTRALTALIRDKGMPNAVIAHDPDGNFDLAALKARGRRRSPPWTASTSCRWSPAPSASTGTRRTWDAGRRLSAARRSSKHHVVAIDYGVKRNILRLLADAGCEVTVVPATAIGRRHSGAEARRRVPVQRPRRPGGDRRIRRAGHPRAAGRARSRPSASASDTRCWPRRRRQDHEDAPGPPRREPPGQGPDHRQGGDHVHEPRLRGRSGAPCRPTRWRRTSPCSTAPIAASR